MARPLIEVWPLATYLAEEMQARGWTDKDVAKRIPGDYTHNLLFVGLTLTIQDEKMILTDQSAKVLADAFGTSPEYIKNLHKSWLENPAGRQPFECPEELLTEWVFPANDGREPEPDILSPGEKA
jgi:plasmid maintenance system antidote protein VapI